MTTPPPPPTALQSSVPVETRLYIEACLHQHTNAINRLLDDALNRLAAQALSTAENVQTLTNTIASLQLQIEDLQSKYNPDDRYVLTRQKIIDFMKKAGIS